MYNQLDTGELTIEHIMPQTLNEDWKSELGINFESIYDTYLHTMGNLTLTGYNSKYSNSSFKEKCNMKKGFLESRLYLNKYIAQQSVWNGDTISARSDLLLERSLKVWPLPDCTFSKTSEDNWIGLDEDTIDFTGKSICQYKLLKDINPASDWTSMYKNVCKSLCQLDRASFISLVNKEFPENKTLEKRFCATGDAMRSPYKVDNDIYIERNLNTQTKVEMLRVVFAHFNIDYQDLSFKLNNNESN